MKRILNNYKYDTILYPTDWRYSAAIIGLKQYLDYIGNNWEPKYEILLNDGECKILKDDNETLGFEGIAYNSGDITEEEYLLFAENFFDTDMQHRKVEKKLNNSEYSDDEIKDINSNLSGAESNSILNKVFKGIKFDGTNAEIIKKTVDSNRFDIIRETYKNKPSMYRNFANKNLLWTDKNTHCRLVGFNVDKGKKSNSTSYNFDINTMTTSDCIEFDFIPFGFTKTFDAVLINNNYSINSLIQNYNKINNVLENTIGRKNIKVSLFKMIVSSADFMDYDVEIITKNRREKFYKTLYLRKSAIKALKKLNEKLVSKKKGIHELDFEYEISKDYRINVQDEIIDICLNSLGFQQLIEVLLKIKEKKDVKDVKRMCLQRILNILIEFDTEWKGEVDKMEDGKKTITSEDIKIAKNCAYIVTKKVPGNKLDSYRKKLISALVFHDYDRVCEIILQLSSYAEVTMTFAYKFFENPEENKNLAFAFANGLEKYIIDENGNKKIKDGLKEDA